MLKRSCRLKKQHAHVFFGLHVKWKSYPALPDCYRKPTLHFNSENIEPYILRLATLVVCGEKERGCKEKLLSVNVLKVIHTFVLLQDKHARKSHRVCTCQTKQTASSPRGVARR